MHLIRTLKAPGSHYVLRETTGTTERPCLCFSSNQDLEMATWQRASLQDNTLIAAPSNGAVSFLAGRWQSSSNSTPRRTNQLFWRSDVKYAVDPNIMEKILIYINGKLLWNISSSALQLALYFCYPGVGAVRVKKIQFLPYGRSIGSWKCLAHKTYISIQNQWRLAILNQFSVLILSYSALFHFLSKMRCPSMAVWGSMIY
jgi:hypothetical protein